MIYYDIERNTVMIWLWLYWCYYSHAARTITDWYRYSVNAPPTHLRDRYYYGVIPYRYLMKAAGTIPFQWRNDACRLVSCLMKKKREEFWWYRLLYRREGRMAWRLPVVPRAKRTCDDRYSTDAEVQSDLLKRKHCQYTIINTVMLNK